MSISGEILFKYQYDGLIRPASASDQRRKDWSRNSKEFQMVRVTPVTSLKSLIRHSLFLFLKKSNGKS
jgi:hypothetical protein